MLPLRSRIAAVCLGASAALTMPAAASAGTYAFTISTRTLVTHLATLRRPAAPARLDSALAYSTKAAWDGPEIAASSPGQHTAWSSSFLSLVAPYGTTFVGSGTVVSYSGCAADAGGWFVQSELKAGSLFKAIRRDTLASGACFTTSGQSPTGASPAGITELRFELWSTLARTTQAKGTYVAVHAVSGILDDPVAPLATMAVDSAAGTVQWATADGQSGPRNVTLVVTGPGSVSAPVSLWASTAQDRSCLTGQWITRCGTSISGTHPVVLPAVTGDYTVAVTVSDGAGNRTTVSRIMSHVAAPVASTSPSLSGIAAVGQTLRVAPATWSNVPTGTTYTFLRDVNGALVVASGPSASSTYVATRIDVGHVLLVRETAANVAGEASVTSAASDVVLPLAPQNGSAIITGGPVAVDRTLGALPGDWDNGGVPGQPRVVATIWRTCVNGVCTQRGIDTTFTPQAADLGAVVELTVQVANAGGTGTSTVRSLPVTAAAPTLDAAPFVVGLPRVGDVLQAGPARWTTHAADATISHLWLTCEAATPTVCAAVGTGESYQVEETQLGRIVRVRETAASSVGDAIATSAPTAAVLARGECIEYSPGLLRACIGPAVVTLAGQLASGTVASGEAATVTGSVALVGPLSTPDRVTLRFVSGDRENRYGQAVVVSLSQAGTFTTRFVPVISGQAWIELTVAGRTSALRLDVGTVRVRPRIAARFTARRDVFGRRRDLRVTGTVSPGVSLPGLKLLIEARLPSGRIVGLICRVDEQPIVASGRFAARCASRGLPAKARYRVIYAGGVSSPLEPATTGWELAALRRA